MKPSQPVVLITGASSGLGRATAEHLHEHGYRVYGTSRKPEAAPELPFPLLQVDVADEASVRQAVEHIVTQEGRLDVVVNNAGYGIAGAVEETTPEEAMRQLDVNLLGVLRVCRAALPVMRRQGSGLILNVSSLGGRVGLPFQGWYSASKFALEGLTEALRMEVAPFGVRVALLEPGDFRTGFTAQRQWTAESMEASPYEERARRCVGVMEADEQSGAHPEQAARLIRRIIETPRPKVRYTVGPLAQRAMIALRPFIPGRLFEWGIRKYYRLDE